MGEENNKSGWVIGAIIILVLAIASYGLFKYAKKDDLDTSITVNPPIAMPPAPTPLPTPTPTPTPTPPVASTNVYKDGTYSATGNYVSPGGAESIGVTLTLKDDVIVDITTVSNAFRPETKIYQGKFISGYKTLVVGKKIDEVALTKVSGSSLTPKGFRDALAQIKVEAKA